MDDFISVGSGFDSVEVWKTADEVFNIGMSKPIACKCIVGDYPIADFII